MTKGFKSTMCKGFTMTFANGLTASVQWGFGNYCDNHHNIDLAFNDTDIESSTAEVAVFHGKRNMIDVNHFLPKELGSCDTVAGWLTPDQVVDFLYKVKNANVID